MTRQMPRQERLKAADDILDNSRDLPHLERQVLFLDRLYRQLARQQNQRA
jgi:dephospho-CoA kinase